ncbi:hypothetical protein [Cryobacterium sp. TMS1-13-1]|nr:hypothetical protein [Cryobacterium sp. TMS1-13-1]
MMLLHEGALVTVGTETFAHPVEVARDVARPLSAARSGRPPVPPAAR